jgi:hypothetical protein
MSLKLAAQYFANKQCMDPYLAIASRTSSNLPNASKKAIYSDVCHARAIQVQAYSNIDSKNHQRRISISSFALVGGGDKSMWLRRIPSRDCMLVMESCSRVATWMIFAADIAFIGLYWCTLQWSFTAPKVH